MKTKNPIGVFDSGVGGLSVLIEVKKSLPYESFVFLADQKNVPYGAKGKKQLKILCENITKFLLKKDIKMLIVACNTASCYAIDHLRSKFSIPIVGVVPALKPAVKISESGKIAVMSTPATAKSLYLKNMVSKFANDMNILKLGCEGLEDSVESLNYKNIEKLLDIYIDKVKNFGADVIVLGCTHYPFLKQDIAKRVGSNVKIIDSGKAIAQRVTTLLNDTAFLQKSRSNDIFYTTGNPQKFSQVASKLLKYNIVGKKAYI